MKQFAVCLASIIFFFSSAITAENKIYHWIDDQGKNHFSDTIDPGEKSEEFTVRDQNLLVNKYTSHELEEERDHENELLTSPPFSKNQAQTYTYEATITSPTDGASIRSNNGTLTIQVATTPEKLNTQKLQLILDGQKLGEPQISTTIGALNIDRGTHQVQVQLLAENGSVLTTTQIVTIHLLRVTVN